jgi:hypothetical protein
MSQQVEGKLAMLRPSELTGQGRENMHVEDLAVYENALQEVLFADSGRQWAEG